MSNTGVRDDLERGDDDRPPNGSEDSQTKFSDANDNSQSDSTRNFWKLKMRAVTDDLPQYSTFILSHGTDLGTDHSRQIMVVCFHCCSPHRGHHWPSSKCVIYSSAGHQVESDSS